MTDGMANILGSVRRILEYANKERLETIRQVLIKARNG
jgi:hypothetical protein